MIRAYDRILLASACDSLGRMIDYSVHSLRMDASSILDLFIASGTAALFGRGDIRLTAGMSGIELTYEVLERSGLTYERIPPRHTMSLSNEYWAGYAMAHAQWESGLSFDEITGRLSIRDLIADAGRERLALLESLPLDISDEDKAAELRLFGESFAAKTAGLITHAGDVSGISVGGAGNALDNRNVNGTGNPNSTHAAGRGATRVGSAGNARDSRNVNGTDNPNSAHAAGRGAGGVSNAGNARDNRNVNGIGDSNSTHAAGRGATRVGSAGNARDNRNVNGIGNSNSAHAAGRGATSVISARDTRDSGNTRSTAAAPRGDTALKRMRQLTGLSQSGLASASGVPVRTIQQYEQRQKDINKAGYIQLVSLASALNCEPASLLEIL